MNALVQAARAYKGTPWKHCGRTARGLDCAGLPWKAYADCGVTLPDRTRYGREPFANGLEAAVVDALGDPVWYGTKGTCPRATLQPGDVVLMSPAGLPRHLALIGDDALHGLSIIHADSTPGIGQVVEMGLIDFFLRQVVAVFRKPLA